MRTLTQFAYIARLAGGLTLAAGLTFGLVGSNRAEREVWVKPIAPGLTYRMEVESDPKRIIHILRLNPASVAVSAKAALAGVTVFEPNATKGKSTVSDMVRQHNAIAGINGDYFGSTGDPIGFLVKSGQLTSLPYQNRAIFAWGPSTAQVGTAKFVGKVTPEGGEPISIDGVNDECGENRLTLNTPNVGLSIAKSPCLTLVMKVDGNVLPPSTYTYGTLLFKTNDATSLPLEPNQFALVARGTKVKALSGLKTGSRIAIDLQTTGFDWPNIDHAIGGGPFLLKAGKVAIDGKEEGFPADHGASRHPRTAVGRCADGDLVFMAVDGRQSMSVGATMEELAAMMLRQGCVDAINLDGGGSTTMDILGAAVNRPSDKTGQRPVVDGIIFSGPRISDQGENLILRASSTLKLKDWMDVSIADEKGVLVPNVEVLWSMQGAAWIDQGGRVHPVIEGEAKITAMVRGRVLTSKVKITR